MSRASQLLARPVTVASQAGGLFPFKGLWYFCTHPYLWPLLKGRLLPCFLLSIFVLANLFIWTYLPQVAFLYLFHHAGAWVNGTFLVLGEGAAIVAIIFEAFFVDETQVDIFDAVLVAKGYEDLVTTRRPVHPDGDDPVKRLGTRERHAVYAPFNLRQIVEFILLLPLNFIPVAGVPLFIFLTGYRAGPLQHWRYFKFLDFDRKTRQRYIKEWRWKYTWFGTSALMLQLVPVLSMFFLLTTTVGSALLVVHMEERGNPVEEDEGPGYIDDPPRQSHSYGTLV
ncbi:hypothetical protein B0J12DRAFT_7251 [Macrophomina phaseolina]|uniref:Uncharacterized protein n=1 Tax=Macrophomina phaseolina TaxID=35725 RepID=A0ABQ8GUB8_9PEZI|nr:hypothetical protein B0J12DRAFT_7251 [Macrophomina phaseolina]